MALTNLEDKIMSDYDASKMNVSKRAIDLLINKIDIAFIWANSPEGHHYWSEVCKKLQAIQSQAEKEGIE